MPESPVLSSIVFVVGLTGVGKSTTLAALETPLTLLPNRRELADTVILPTVQRELGQDPAPVNDRLERFTLTARYREQHSGGMVHALAQYLKSCELVNSGATYLFDNIRGLNECRAAAQTFPNLRYLFLDAAPLVRLQRLIGRGDAFDKVAATFIKAPLNKGGWGDLSQGTQDAADSSKALFNPHDIARLEARGAPEDKLLNAIRIIVAEHQNYDADQAAAYLKAELNDERLLYLDTGDLSISEVTARIGAWL